MAGLQPSRGHVRSAQEHPLNSARPTGGARHVSPFRYAGGKSPLLHQTRAWLASLTSPPHLVEGFAGGASIGLTALVEGQAHRLTLVELDHDIAEAWRVIFSPQASDLCRRLRASPTVAAAHRMLTGPPPADDVERALHLLILNRLRRNGILAPGAGLIPPGRPDSDYRYNPESLARRIELLARYRRRVDVIEKDAIEVLSAYASDNDTAFYLDPPYSAPGGPGRRLYRHWSLDHERFFEVAAGLRGDVVISHQDHQLTRRLGSEHGFRLATVGIPTSNGRRGELLMSRRLDWLVEGCLPVTLLPLGLAGPPELHERASDGRVSGSCSLTISAMADSQAVGLVNAKSDAAPGWAFIGIEADFHHAGFVETARKRIRHAAGHSVVEVSDEASVLAA